MIKVTIINAGFQSHYIVGLVNGLTKIKDLTLDVIDCENSVSLFRNLLNIRHINIREYSNYNVSFFKKIINVLILYKKLVTYFKKTDSRIIHIQWLNKFYFIDRTLLLLYYKLLGKKIIFTAHNVDENTRSGKKSNMLNKWSLKFFYRKVDHIIVHTKHAKLELIERFKIPSEKITIIPHGINIIFPLSKINSNEARNKLNINLLSKVILFFGRFEYYKGVDILIDAFELIMKIDANIFLILAGYPSNKKYVELLQRKLKEKKLYTHVLSMFNFLNDEEIEIIMKAADCVVLPYRGIYQSGVLFLAYAFGKPVIASNVGNFPNDVIENETGFIFKSEDAKDLSFKIQKFFQSKLFLNKEKTTQEILKYVNEIYSWDKIAFETYKIYKQYFN